MMHAINGIKYLGGTVPDIAGPVHAYRLASPRCWNLYCSLLDWTNSLRREQGVTAAPQLVDAYATNADRRNRQPLAVHLMSLYAGLEPGIPRGTSLRSDRGLDSSSTGPVWRTCADRPRWRVSGWIRDGFLLILGEQRAVRVGGLVAIGGRCRCCRCW
jgi:hypothetical protein